MTTVNTHPATLPYQAPKLLCFRIGLLWVHHSPHWHYLYHLSAVRILSERFQRRRDLAQLDMQMGFLEREYIKPGPLFSRLP
jgi:hypothetical protein